MMHKPIGEYDVFLSRNTLIVNEEGTTIYEKEYDDIDEAIDTYNFIEDETDIEHIFNPEYGVTIGLTDLRSIF